MVEMADGSGDAEWVMPVMKAVTAPLRMLALEDLRQVRNCFSRFEAMGGVRSIDGGMLVKREVTTSLSTTSGARRRARSRAGVSSVEMSAGVANAVKKSWRAVERCAGTGVRELMISRTKKA